MVRTRKRSTATIIKPSDHEKVKMNLKSTQVGKQFAEQKFQHALEFIRNLDRDLKLKTFELQKLQEETAFKQSLEYTANKTRDETELSQDFLKIRSFVYSLGIEFAKAVTKNKDRINEITLDYYNKIPSELRNSIEKSENIDELIDEPLFETRYVNWLIAESEPNGRMNVYYCTVSLLEQKVCRTSRRNTKVNIKPTCQLE